MLSTSDIQLELLKLGEEASKVISPQLPYVQYVPKESVEVEASVKVLSNKVDKLDLFSINNGNGNFSSVLSLDSSSRILKSTFMDLVVIGASAFSTERGFYTFPFEVSGRYIGVASYLEILRRLEGAIKSGYLAFRNLVGYEYALDEVEMDNGRVESLYHLDDVADELRVEAENNIIRSSKEDLLILDGPLFPTPRELSQSFVFSRPKDYS
ncbi:MAG: DNA double-strand break repair nuclease NurA, partial [Stygiolobus sp.]|nr:DNA double-strand break repair nuclease NurA [Stygiolobus sp.]